MKVSINRESPIPLHDQLVTQISLLIAAGVIAPGQRLPSVRDLAGRLDIHRNTVQAVYETLEEQGIVVVKPGSGVRVIEMRAQPGASAWQEGVALRALATQFVTEARARGHDDRAIHEAFELALRPETIHRIVVVDPHADFHPIYRQELSCVFACPIETVTVEALAARGAEAFEDAALVTTMYHLTPLQAVVGPLRRVVVIEVNAADAVLADLKGLQDGATVGLISVSETLQRMAGEVIAGLRGDALDLLNGDPNDAAQITAIGRLADLVIVDSVCFEAVQSRTAKPLRVFSLIPDGSIRSLAQQLPPEAFRLNRPV